MNNWIKTTLLNWIEDTETDMKGGVWDKDWMKLEKMLTETLAHLLPVEIYKSGDFAWGWNECLDSVKSRLFDGTPPIDNPGYNLHQANSDLLLGSDLFLENWGETPQEGTQRMMDDIDNMDKEDKNK